MAVYCLPKASCWTGKTIPVLLLLLIPLTLNAEGNEGKERQKLKPSSAVYSLSGGGFPFTIRGERTLKERSDGTWELTIRAGNLLGEVRETSRFEWHDDCHARTLSYGYLRRGLGMRREAKVEVNHDKGEATSQRHNRDSETFEAGPETTDTLSQGIALQCHVARGDREMELEVIDERRLRTMKYEAGEKEKVQTRMGHIPAIPVERVRDDDSDRTTTMWFAPEMDYALVRMLQEENGDRFELQIREYNP